jgi:hypothetical protein
LFFQCGGKRKAMSKLPRFGAGGASSIVEGGAAAAIIGKVGQIGNEFSEIKDWYDGDGGEPIANFNLPTGFRTGGGGVRGGSLGPAPQQAAAPTPTRPVIPQQRISQVDNALSRAGQRSNNQQSRGFTVDGDGDVFMQPRAPGPGDLLPLDADWGVEEGALRDAIRRDRIQRGVRNAALIGLGGITANEIRNTWKERAEWIAKNSGTPYEAKFPVPGIIPTDGAGDLDPSMKPPELPVFPAETNPRAPQERTASNWILPINNQKRARFVNSNESKIDCSC